MLYNKSCHLLSETSHSCSFSISLGRYLDCLRTLVLIPYSFLFPLPSCECHGEDEGEFFPEGVELISCSEEGRWLWAWSRLRDELLGSWVAWKLKLKWSEVRKEAVRGGRLHRDSTLMGEVDLNHQSLVIGRLLYLTTSAPGMRTRELPIGKQDRKDRFATR